MREAALQALDELLRWAQEHSAPTAEEAALWKVRRDELYAELEKLT